MKNQVKFNLLTATASIGLLFGIQSLAAAPAHTTLNECLTYGGDQCNGDPDYPGCIDFVIDDCEGYYLPSATQTNMTVVQINQARATLRNFRSQSIRAWNKKKSSKQ